MTGVLVCDDAPDMRALLREAADGPDAVRLAAALQPDVVLLDIGMPGPGPVEVIASVRRAAPGAAIVVLSGHGPERLGGVAGQETAHLPKTTELSAVRRTVHAAAGAV